jgi:hypothetical protein
MDPMLTISWLQHSHEEKFTIQALTPSIYLSFSFLLDVLYFVAGSLTAIRSAGILTT